MSLILSAVSGCEQKKLEDSGKILSELHTLLKSKYAFKTRLTTAEVPCPNDATVVMIFGQSNSSNRVPRSKHFDLKNGQLYQWNWVDQKCALYSEPVSGADGDLAGNAITPTLTMIQDQIRRPIVIVAFGVGATSVTDWAEGPLSQVHETTLIQLKLRKLKPVVVFFHQGETEGALTLGRKNAQENAQSSKDYERKLEKIIHRQQHHFPKTWFG
ncbi:MAG: hypothetical protein EOP04_20445, partial [Proteobacteria bacterium]